METMLEVPYSEKDEAKALGARWDVQSKKWYVPKGIDADKFSRWIPRNPARTGNIHLVPPIYLAKSYESCWKCGKTSDVYCIASSSYIEDGEEFEFFATFSNLFYCDDALKTTIEHLAPRYRPAYSKQAGYTYYMNHCNHCGAKIGDFFMHCEPEGAFSPIDKVQARQITLYELSELSKISLVDGRPAFSEPPLIQLYAKTVVL